MGSQIRQLHLFFFPFMAHGHMIPTVDMAKLFASRGVKATIVTTPVNAPLISKAIERTTKTTLDMVNIHVKTIDFPCEEVHLPLGCENADSLTSRDMVPKFFKATGMLQEQFEQLLQDQHPDGVVADMFFPWTTASAAKFGIPRLVFHATCFFSICASECVRLYEPHKNVSSDTEPFAIPHFPGQIEITRTQLPGFFKGGQDEDGFNGLREIITAVRESELTSYGVVFNSFYELEPVYSDYYREELGRRVWHIGPLSLINGGMEEKSHRGKEASISEHECLRWLESKQPNSVVYVCFGSIANFTNSQLKEIALGLEASGQQFIWVVKKGKDNDEEEKEEWLPEGFENRMEDKGLIIRGWAPQVLILDHEGVRGFVTHCGWNSTLEGVCAGVSFVTWPVAAEQFYTEKLVTRVLKIGVEVGAKKWEREVGDFVKREDVEKAVRRLMAGEEAEEMRSRAKALAEKARQAVDVGGSSYNDFNALIEELGSIQTSF